MNLQNVSNDSPLTAHQQLINNNKIQMSTNTSNELSEMSTTTTKIHFKTSITTCDQHQMDTVRAGEWQSATE